MSTLQAIPTQHGIDILNSELKSTVTEYRLIGALTHDALSESLYSFYESTIETSYYDLNGVLTFVLNLPIEQAFDEYLHQIHVLDSNNQSVIECSTPKVALPKGIGGMVTLKVTVAGEAGEIVFKQGEFLTETELTELHLAPIKAELENMVGMVGQFHCVGEKRGWVDLRGGTLSRETDQCLWNYASQSNMVMDQMLKHSDPMKYAMYFGDGDGNTTFTLPNHHLGHFIRGASGMGRHGETQGDAIRNIYGTLILDKTEFHIANGAFSKRNGNWSIHTPSIVYTENCETVVDFNASSQVPTSNENRPYTANLSIKIHRGWF